MSSVTFDKLRYIEKLESSGVSHEQAKAQADALDDALRETVATKYDIAELKRDMKELEIRLTHSLTLRMGAMIVAATAFLAAIKFFD